MKVETNSERILAAAQVCPSAKETLKTLFPEVFESEYVPFVKDFNNFNSSIVGGELRADIQIGYGSVPLKLEGRCLVLSSDYTWEIIDNPNKGCFPKALVCKRK
jgi:hypothetical protein